MQDLIEVSAVPTRPKRRSFSKEFKADLVAECEAGVRSVAQVAMAHQINANQLRRWQREINTDSSKPNLVPVKVARPQANDAVSIEVAIGNAIVKFNGPVDPASARTLIDLLR